MCVCVCVCVCVCLCVCVFVCVYISIYLYIFTCVYIYIYMIVYIYVYIHICVYIYIYIYVYVYMYMYICIYIYKHIYIYVSTYHKLNGSSCVSKYYDLNESCVAWPQRPLLEVIARTQITNSMGRYVYLNATTSMSHQWDGPTAFFLMGTVPLHRVRSTCLR